MPAITIGIAALLAGYIGAGLANALWQFTIVHVLIGLGSSATFAPLMAEASHWFVARRGIAVTIAASGNYLAGAIWPPIVERGTAMYGWRATHIAVGLFCAAAMALALLVLRAIMRGTNRQTLTASAAERGCRHQHQRAHHHPLSSPRSPAAWRCRCRRCTSSPTAATSATASRAAPRCWR